MTLIGRHDNALANLRSAAAPDGGTARQVTWSRIGETAGIHSRWR